MSNAAVWLKLEAYDTGGPQPFGRGSAAEGFLRALLRHADVERFYAWNPSGQDQDALQALLDRLGPPGRPVTWIDRADRAAISEPGALHMPTPELQGEAWARRAVGGNAYSLTGMTQSLAEASVIDEIAAMLTAPVEAWDALVCTSEAGHKAVETLLQAVAEHLQERFGATRIPPAQLVTIPLGVFCEDFEASPGARQRWRERLGVPPDAPAALYAGRFNVETKMHPGPMGLALQEAARRLKRPVWWILYGGAPRPADEAAFRAAAAAFCPDVELRFADDTSDSARADIAAAADVFLSLADNVQEAFGLTPIEAMAAGLPCVVSDWDGYRDTVRHGVEGLRIRTIAPRPGLGADLAYAHAHRLSGYEAYVGATAQFAAVDVGDAAEALALLMGDEILRRRMSEAGRERARSTFDWRHIIPQHQALWAELARRRQAAPPQPPRLAGDNPWRLDPFRMFAGHPTAALGPEDIVSLVGVLEPAEALRRLALPDVRSGARLPTDDEVLGLLGQLEKGPRNVAALIERAPPERRAVLERGLVWLAKYGFLRLGPAPSRT